MNLTYEDVYDKSGRPHALALAILYSHLETRDARANISHLEMPTWDQHVAFVSARPYPAWFLVYDQEKVEAQDNSGEAGTEFACIGQVYVTRGREIGIQIQNRYWRQGYASEIVNHIVETFQPRGPFFANIAINNDGSRALFEGLGFRLIQHTYRIDPVFFDEEPYPGHPAMIEARRQAALQADIENAVAADATAQEWGQEVGDDLSRQAT